MDTNPLVDLLGAEKAIRVTLRPRLFPLAVAALAALFAANLLVSTPAEAQTVTQIGEIYSGVPKSYVGNARQGNTSLPSDMNSFTVRMCVGESNCNVANGIRQKFASFNASTLTFPSVGISIHSSGRVSYDGTNVSANYIRIGLYFGGHLATANIRVITGSVTRWTAKSPIRSTALTYPGQEVIRWSLNQEAVDAGFSINASGLVSYDGEGLIPTGDTYSLTAFATGAKGKRSTGKSISVAVQNPSPGPPTLQCTEEAEQGRRCVVPQGWRYIPKGVQPGDSFRLMFVTSETIQAGDRRIATYNTFVQGSAAKNPLLASISEHFRVLASVYWPDPAGGHARINTKTRNNDAISGGKTDIGASDPIYWIGGPKIADGYADMFDRSWDHNAEGGSPTTNLEANFPADSHVWTGAGHRGDPYQSRQLGDNPLAVIGDPNHHGSEIEHVHGNVALQSVSEHRSLYAMSPLLTVAKDVECGEPTLLDPENKGQICTVPYDWKYIPTKQPTRLESGDSFRLVFVTRGTRDATSAAIADYNAFVQHAAARNPDLSTISPGFRALASANFDARGNTKTRAGDNGEASPIYWLNGTALADGYTSTNERPWSLYNSEQSWINNVVPDELGDRHYNPEVSDGSGLRVWTGSAFDGSRSTIANPLSHHWLGRDNPRYGIASGRALSQGTLPKATKLPLYAISPVLKVGPDPRPKVQSIAIASTPADGETYRHGETIEIEVAFNEPVTASSSGAGALRLSVNIGSGASRRFNSNSLTGYATTVRFSRTVGAGDSDADGIGIPANALSLGSNVTLRDADGHDALLGHEAFGDQDGHRVRGGVPAAPTGFGAVAGIGSGKIRLTWNNPNDGSITKYQYTINNGANWSDISDSPTSHTVTSLTNGTTYAFKLRAVNGAGPGAESAEASATPQAAVKPGATLLLSRSSISENGGATTVTATLDRAHTHSVTLTVAVTPQSPATTSDFTLSNNKMLSFAAQQTTSTGEVTITAVDNDLDTVNKRLTVSATSSSNDVTAPVSKALTIVDDDDPPDLPTVELRLSPSSIDEGRRGTAVVTARLSKAHSAAVTINVSVVPETPATSADYASSINTTLTIPVGETASTGEVTITALDDDVDTGDKQLMVWGVASSDDAVAGPDPMTLTIMDDESISDFSAGDFLGAGRTIWIGGKPVFIRLSGLPPGADPSESSVMWSRIGDPEILDGIYLPPHPRIARIIGVFGDSAVELVLVLRDANGEPLEEDADVRAEVCLSVPAADADTDTALLKHDGAAWSALEAVDPPAGFPPGTGGAAVCGATENFSVYVPASVETAVSWHGRLISRIEPSIRAVTVSAGDSVRLSFDIYGRQDILDNELGEGLVFGWADGGTGGGFRATNRANTIIYTAPSNPGTHTVTVEAPAGSCVGGGNSEERCSAEFEIRVKRSSAAPAPASVPIDPEGEIPSVLVDSEGEQYEVFTPVDGGRFQGEGFSLAAAPGAVPNGEFVGLRMHDAGPASNAGMIAQRYTLTGNRYRISAVGASGIPVSSYRLNAPIEACIPLPHAARTNISDIAMVATNPDDTLTVLSATVRIRASSTDVCGNLSTVPATLAAGTAGAPAAIPTATPEPTPEAPDTGGSAPPSTRALLWLLLIGIGITAIGATALHRRAARTPPQSRS